MNQLQPLEWDHRGFPMISSPFIHFSFEYNAALFDWLAPLADEIEFDVDLCFEDLDWQFDCQDVQDVLEILDFIRFLRAQHGYHPYWGWYGAP